MTKTRVTEECLLLEIISNWIFTVKQTNMLTWRKHRDLAADVTDFSAVWF